MKESLDFIYKEQKELSHFGGIAALLGWDQMTYMPQKGSEERAEQLSLISRLAHERVISDEFYNHLKKLDEHVKHAHRKRPDHCHQIKGRCRKSTKSPLRVCRKNVKDHVACVHRLGRST